MTNYIRVVYDCSNYVIFVKRPHCSFVRNECFTKPAPGSSNSAYTYHCNHVHTRLECYITDYIVIQLQSRTYSTYTYGYAAAPTCSLNTARTRSYRYSAASDKAANMSHITSARHSSLYKLNRSLLFPTRCVVLTRFPLIGVLS